MSPAAGVRVFDPVSVAPGSRRILIVIGSLGRGGTEGQLAAIAPALMRRGWSVSVFSFAGGVLAGELERNGVPVIIANGRFWGGRGISLRTMMRLTHALCHLFTIMLRDRPPIVHFFLPQAYLLGAPVAVIARMPIRVMSRRSLNHYQRAYPKLIASLERRLHSTMAAVLGNSLSVSRELADEGVPEDKLVTIYNGIDLRRFEHAKPKGEVRHSLNLASETLVLVVVANLIPYKGHRDLIEAMALAKPRMPGNWQVLVVGRDDGIGQDLRRRASELAIDAHISFLGSRSDVPDLLSACDIALSCSHEEGFSNAILEAMASGLPTIVTRVGGNPEAVIDGVTGLVVPPHDPSALAEAIVRLGNDHELRMRYGRAGKDRIEREFSLDRCVERHEALYLALLEGRNPLDATGQRA